MTVALVRIDDRLVHGQVVEGWLRALRATTIVVASDTVAVDEIQKALYTLAVPQGVHLNCLTIEETISQWKAGAWEKDKTLILISNPQDAVRLLNGGAALRSVNVGGLHYKEGRIQILKAVSLDETDVAAFRQLLGHGVALEVRPLPLDEAIDLGSYLERWSSDQAGLREQPQ